MAIIQDECTCGEKVVILTGNDSKNRMRKDGKQAIYPDCPPTKDYNYNIYRCRGCLEVLNQTTESFRFS
jgi:hypothetical protein